MSEEKHDNTNLQEDNTDDNMGAGGNGNAGEGAGNENPEDTLRKVIDGQKATIDTLMEQVESLNGQIAKLVRSQGAKVDDSDNPDKKDEPSSIPENYVYLKDLGAEIGKRD